MGSAFETFEHFRVRVFGGAVIIIIIILFKYFSF